MVPDFQREFEWDPWDIRDLMRSIFLDYYVGSLLLWRGKPESYRALSCEPIFAGPTGGSPEYIVLDGQQRLTAIHYGFCAPAQPLPHRKTRARYFIRVDKLMADELDDAFDYEWDWGSSSRLTNDLDYQFREHVFPLATVGAGGWALPNWVQGYERHWEGKDLQHVANAASFGSLLKGITENFQVSYVELDRELELEKVCDIFTQLNSKGIRLDVFDLMNALLKPKGLQLKQMWRDAKSRLSFVDVPKMNVYVLQVMSILRQAYCSPKFLYFLIPGQERPVRLADGTVGRELLIGDIEDFAGRWEAAVSALEDAIVRLRHPHEFGVTGIAYLPYVSILPVFAAIGATISELPPTERLTAGRKFRHWYWASIFTNRYSGSVESTSARDFQDMRNWLADDAAEPALIADFNTRAGSLDFRSEVKRGSSSYNAVFNLLVIQGARDWMTGDIPRADELDDHHIVPASWGRENIPGGLFNSILNRTPLSAETNRHVISDRLPNQYLPELIRRSGREAIEALMASHFISPLALNILLREPFTPADFELFIAERQRAITVAIQSLLVLDRVNLPPNLRLLDERVERVERGLRALLVRATDNDIRRLPGHITAKIDERVQGELRRNPAMDVATMRTVAGALEYADLRELEHAICNDQLWPQFEAEFGTKQGLAMRFGQLAGLRNGIRHLRTLESVAVKDGEAALEWFEAILRMRARDDRGPMA